MKHLTIIAAAALLTACAGAPIKTCSHAGLEPAFNCERNDGSSPKPAAERPAPSKPTDPKGPPKGEGPKNPGKDHHGGPKGPKGPKGGRGKGDHKGPAK